MTPNQENLYRQVLADESGRDLRDILRSMRATNEDKQAVADQFGGPGAGQRDFS